MGAGKKSPMRHPALLIALLLSCEQVTVGDDCSAENHCQVVRGEPRCDPGYEFEDPSDDTNLKCVAMRCPTEGEQRCSGMQAQQCTAGAWTTSETCTGSDSCVLAASQARCRNMMAQCGSNGLSCINGSEVVRCVDGYFETVQTCDEDCTFVGQEITCLGGARTFSPVNVAAILDGAVRVSISTVSGPIGCGLIDDYESSPGLTAESIYLILANVGFECPVGTYGLNQGCDVGYPLDSGARCAIYRRWNGERLESVEALSGAVTIALDGSTCSFALDVVAGGQQMNVRFSQAAPATGEWCAPPI